MLEVEDSVLAARHVDELIRTLLVDPTIHKATKYIEPNLTAKAKRQTYEDDKKRGRFRKIGRSVTILVTVGRPNHAERAMVKKLIAAGEPFPVKKVMLKRL